MTASRFNSRLEAIDEGSQEFLQRLIELGGYCTADQAKRLTLSDESTGTRARLYRGLLRKSAQLIEKNWRPRRDLNPCYRRERAMS